MRAHFGLISLTVAAALSSGSFAAAGAANANITAQPRFPLQILPSVVTAASAVTPAQVSVAGTPVAQNTRPPIAPAPDAPASDTAQAPAPAADQTPDESIGPHPGQPAGLPAAAAFTTAVAGSASTFGTAEASVLKAVVIVGPSGSSETRANLAQAEDFAARAAKYGMDVRRVFYPHATWKSVLDNINGVNLVIYFGHGNGWPSPYPPFQERSKDGFGLDSRDGGGPNDVTYYGADYVRRAVTLAPDAVVVLSHNCYSAGNAEPGMPIPTADIAAQRVDNTASGFLAVGAGAVFAYATGSPTPILDGLFGAADQTIDQIFMAGGHHRRPYYGFTGWNDQYVLSVRTPGARSHLDPGKDEGYVRAVTGNLSMTAADWRAPAG